MHLLIWNLVCKAITFGSRLHVSGQDKIPSGPKIFAINHPTSFDPCYIYGFTENAAILMTQFIFNLPIAGRLVSGCEFIPVRLREKCWVDRGVAYVNALNTVLKDRNLLIAPEGKMSLDNAVGRYHNGAARLSWVAGVPIVPVNIRHIGEIKEFYIGNQLTRYMPRGDTFITFKEPYQVTDSDLTRHTERIMEQVAN